MKAQILRHSNDYWQLEIAGEAFNEKRPCIAASMTIYEGSDVGIISDVRYAHFRKPGPQLHTAADDLYGFLDCGNPEDQKLVHSWVRNHYTPSEHDLKPNTVYWSSLNGIAPGQSGTELFISKGFPLLPAPAYFTRENAYRYMQELQLFWESIEPSADVDWFTAACNLKLVHPHACVTTSQASFHLHKHRRRASA